MPRARYDGQTVWYDDFASAELFTTLRAEAVRLLGPARGRCLDLGCGTGRAIALLREAGWEPVGIDPSGDQLRAARAQAGDGVELLQGTAESLPFADGSFAAVLSLLTHTDFESVADAFDEVARVLEPGGSFVYAGVHPCFASPAVEARTDGTFLLHAGYRREGWQTLSRNPENPGIRSRVGINHVTLSSLLNAALASGLDLVETAEPGDRDPPLFFAFRSVKR